MNKQEAAARNDSLKKKQRSLSSAPKLDYKSPAGLQRFAGASSHNKFAALAKIIEHMKNRHMSSLDFGLTMYEILDETQLLDADNKVNKYYIY